MTITLPLEPQDEARLMAAAQAKGLSLDALVRAALDRVLAEEAGISGPATGAALVAAMQASPYREIDLGAARHRFPVRDVGL
ncbi:MAG: hypothetical protein ABSH45_02970 [Bryobacteraceae bacterium]|jgi:hypothetical protein